MAQYFNVKTQTFNKELWSRDQINRDIYLKVMSKTKNSNNETSVLRSYFQYYDIYNCRHIDFNNFIKVLNRMGILDLTNYDQKYKVYFNNITNNKPYLNYFNFCEETRNSFYKNRLDSIYNSESFSKQYDMYTKNNYFHRPSNAPYDYQ